ncbi:hypothetical protein [Cetobacterium sp.]
MGRVNRAILIYCVVKSIIFSATPEEAYIELEMKGQKNEFYRVLIDEETEKMYIGVGEFIDFARMDEVKFDKKRMRVKGKLDAEREIDIKIPKESSIETEDDIFIELDEFKRYFFIPESNWDNERYILNLYPEFKTSKESQDELNNQRSLLAMAKKERELEAKGDYIKKEKSLLSPGILKLSYTNSDIENNEYAVDIDYGTELLYGEFQISQKVYPESNLEYIRLQYREIFNNYYLTFGDFYLESDSIFDSERSMRGASFSKNEYYGIRIDNRTVIEGEAYNANLVELYRNGSLDDFQMVTGDRFRFDVINLSSTDRYTLKIYYRDGREETKEIYVLGNQNILNKGESDFVVQLGEGKDDKKNQYLGKFKYGLTKDLTVVTGVSLLENKLENKYEVLEGGVAYRFGLDEYPTLISGTFLEEFNSKELSFKGTGEQKLPYNTNLTMRYEKYRDKTAKRLKKDYSYNIDLSKEFRKLSGSVGYFKNSYEADDLHQIYLSLDYTLSRSVRMSLTSEYYKYSTPNTEPREVQGYGTQGKITYSGMDGIVAVLEGRVNYEESEMTEDEIKFGIAKSPTDKGFFKDVDAAFEVGHSKDKGTFFEVRFTYIFDGDIYIEFPDIRREDNKTRVGGRIEKSFYLGNPLLKINNNNVTDGWVEGKVFVDENSNGIMDENEDIYEGAEVIASGGTSSVKKNGKYIIGNISNKDIHMVEVNKETIDPMLIQGKEQIKFKGAISSGVKVDIPLVPVSMITGVVGNGEGTDEREYNSMLAGLNVILKKGDEEIGRTQPEIDGYYFFENILPGEYVVELLSTSKRYKGSFDRQRIEIGVKAGREGEYYEDNNFLIKNIEVVEDEILDEEEIEVKKDEENS